MVYSRPMGRVEIFLGLGIAVLLRAGFAAYSSRHGMQIPTDVGSFETIARNLLAHGQYAVQLGQPTALREPGYVLFIAGIYALFGPHPSAVVGLQIALSALTAWLVYTVAGGLFGPFCGRAAFWLTVFYPYFIYYPTYFFRETLMGFLVIGMFYCYLRRDFSWTLLAGLAAAGLAVTNAAFIPALCAAALLFWKSSAGRERLIRSLIYVTPVLLALSAWTIRNYRTFDAMIAGSTLVGQQMYITLTVPYEMLGEEGQVRITGADEVFRRYSNVSEIEMNREFSRESLKIVKREPLAFLKGCLTRFIKIWRPLPHPRQPANNLSLIRLLALLSDGWLLPMAILGIIRERRNATVLYGVAPILFLVTLTYSISNAPIRYRVPLMPLALVLAARGATSLWRKNEKA